MRVKRGKISKKKHNKLLKSVKGYRMTKRRLIKVAKEAQLHAGAYSYAGRKHKKNDFRRLWITRINSAVKSQGFTYSRFINMLKQKNINLDRKILSYLAVNDEKALQKILDKIRES